jgi:pimeloyl-ACP methyl ester carboxylesterase
MTLPLFARSPDGVRLAYEVSGEGKPVLLIHGFASSREQNWESTGWIRRLVQSGFRVAAFDCRGHGESDKPHDPAAYGERMIDDILAVMDAAGMPVADVMGYSMGAMLTIRLLVSHPGRVRRAVTAGVGETYFNEMPSWREMIADAVLVEDPNALQDRRARRFRIFGGQRGKDRQALSACMRAPRELVPPAVLKTVQTPVLVVAGELDDMTGSPLPLAQAFGNGRVLVVPNKDHMTAVGDPGYKRAVLEFFGA